MLRALADGSAASPPRTYTAFGMRWQSSLALPFAGQQVELPDVTAHLGQTPTHLPGHPSQARRAAHLWEARPGMALLSVPGVARYFVEPSEIVVEPTGGSEDDIVAFLVGPVATALLQQRGMAVLHAAAVEVYGEAVVLAGSSGAGKSALAWALAQQGHALLADNVTALAPAGGSRLAALPAYPRLRLWPDVLPEAARERRTREGLEKYWVTVPLADGPRPIRAVVLLESHNREAFDVERLSASRAFRAVWAHTPRKRLLNPLGQRHAHYRAAVALAGIVPCYRIRRPDHPFRIAELADQVEALAAQPSTSGRPCRNRGMAERRTQRPNVGVADAPRPRHSALKRPGIVWIAAYPKSGTTWLRTMLSNYLADGDAPASINALVGQWGASARDKFDELIGIDSSDLRPAELARYLPAFRELLAEAVCRQPVDAVESASGPCLPYFAKTHEAFQGPVGGPRFSAAGTAGAIYLVRNPLDVAVSYAHHLQLPIDQTIRRMNRPDADEVPAVSGIRNLLPNPLRTWREHVGSWVGQKTVRTCVVRYEELLADPIAGFGKVVRFAGLEWQPDRVAWAVDHAAFPRLRAQEAEYGFGERQQTAPSFFRAGVAGDWRRVLTRDQVQAVLDAHGPMMARFGYLEPAEAALRSGECAEEVGAALSAGDGHR